MKFFGGASSNLTPDWGLDGAVGEIIFQFAGTVHSRRHQAAQGCTLQEDWAPHLTSKNSSSVPGTISRSVSKKGIQRIVRNCRLYYPKRESFVYNLKDSGSGSSSRTFLAHVITKQRLQQIHTIQNSAFWAKESKWEGISQAAAVRDSANMLQLW